MWVALHKEQTESDPEGSMALPNITTIPNYNLFDFLKEGAGAPHRTPLSDSNYDECE